MLHATLTWSDWTFEPTVTLALIGGVIAYALAWRYGILRKDDDVSAWLPASWLRPLFFAAGIACAALALESPIDTGGDNFLFWLHMIQHLMLMMITPPLVLLGICGMRDPLPRRFGLVRAVATFITRPWVACVIFNAVMLIWHIPVLYEATLTTLPLHVFEHITFVVAGFVLWWPVVDPLCAGAKRVITGMTKIAMLVVAGVPPTVLGFAFISARGALYPFYIVAPRLWGFTALSDQQLAGVVMLGLGNIIYFIAIAVIFVRLFEDPEVDEARARVATSITS